MKECFVANVSNNFYPELEEEIMPSIFKEYERVIIQSLITSFGLDFLINDRHGGDVDTIHNVRQIGKDPEMTYKNKQNQEDYNNREKYNSDKYHNDQRYRDKREEVNQQKKDGTLTDSYTGKQIGANDSVDIDHTISAKEINDDRGRVLAGMDGTDLANSESNLNATNSHTNRSKNADSMDDYLEKHGDEYTEEQKENMRKKDAEARKQYNQKIAVKYYTSKKFMKDTTVAAASVGVKMGFKQAVGLVFAEIWFSVKEEFEKIKGNIDLGNFFTSIGDGIKRGIECAKRKYKEILAKFKEGLISGVLSSITTTLCNIFFTTAKTVVKIIRQTWASIVEAAKILFINPDNLLFGDRLRAVVKILATGASVVVGGIIGDLIGKTPLGAIPFIGDIVQTFCGTLVTGIMSCTLLYFLDRSTLVNKLVNRLNEMDVMNRSINYYRQQAAYFERYAAELMNIDLELFKKEAAMYHSLSDKLSNIQSEEEMSTILEETINRIGIKLPWTGDFDDFMSNRNNKLVFE